MDGSLVLMDNTLQVGMFKEKKRLQIVGHMIYPSQNQRVPWK